MLILSRRATERIYLGDEIVLTIVAVGTDKVRIGVKAPSGVRILRDELELQTETDQTFELSTEIASLDPSEQEHSLPFPKLAKHSVMTSDEADKQGAQTAKHSAPPSGLGSFIRTRRAA
ncbi:MAG: hypothetical protein Aurels2KO_42400 [Aureliella sp.]